MTVALYWLNCIPGVWPTMSVTSFKPSLSTELASNAVTEVPTSCRFCSRRCAVTMISSSLVVSPVSAAGEEAHGAETAIAANSAGEDTPAAIDRAFLKLHIPQLSRNVVF